MSLLDRIFGKKHVAAVPVQRGRPDAPAETTIVKASVYCDCCNQAASFATGTYYTASEFITLLEKGLEPHQSVFFLMQISGMSREALIAALPGQISLTYTTGWLLCPSCA